MKLAAALVCLAAIGMTSGAVAQTSPAGRTAPGTSATSDSGVRARGGVDTSPETGNPVQKADQFKDEASAKSHCPSDTVVWVNLNSKAYHAAGTKYYGKTKNGAYECTKDADADGFHPAGHKKTASAATTAPAH